MMPNWYRATAARWRRCCSDDEGIALAAADEPVAAVCLHRHPCTAHRGRFQRSAGRTASALVQPQLCRQSFRWQPVCNDRSVFHDDVAARSEEHTSETPVTNAHLVCRLLLEKKKN